jgi:hypothetical protein
MLCKNMQSPPQLVVNKNVSRDLPPSMLFRAQQAEM